MSSEDLKNRILEKLNNKYVDLYEDDDYNISNTVKIGGGHCGGASAGSLMGGNKEVEKKLKQQTAPNLRKLILSKNIRGVTKMSKKELVDVIMQNIDRFPEVHKLKSKPKRKLTESEKEVLRNRLAKARSMKKGKPKGKVKVQEDEEEDEFSYVNDYDQKRYEKNKAEAKKRGIKVKSHIQREKLLKKMKVSDLRKILKMGGIKGYSTARKEDLIREILNNPQIYGGNFFDTLKSIGSTVLDVGKVVAPFVPLLL